MWCANLFLLLLLSIFRFTGLFLGFGLGCTLLRGFGTIHSGNVLFLGIFIIALRSGLEKLSSFAPREISRAPTLSGMRASKAAMRFSSNSTYRLSSSAFLSGITAWKKD